MSEQQNEFEIEKKTFLAPQIKKILILFIFIAVFGIIASLGVSLFTNYIGALPEITVPDVSGLTKEDGEFVLRQNNLLPYQLGTRFSTGISDNIILETIPEAGSKVKSGRNIGYFIAFGQEVTAVPALVGQTLWQAQSLIKELGLTIEHTSSDYSSEYREGAIIEQFPLPGEYIDQATTISIILSKGYPVEITATPIPDNFEKAHLKIQLTIPDSNITSKTNLKIISIHENETTERYNDTVSSGKELIFDYEEALGSKIEIHYNGVVVKSFIVTY